MRQFFVAQNAQEIIDLTLEWLGVNHVDEVVQQSSDGRRLMIADPDLAWALLSWAVKLDPNVRLHPNMNGNESLPGSNPQGVLASTYLQSEKLRRENLEIAQRPGNLPSVTNILKRKLGLKEEVSRPTAGASNSNQGALNVQELLLSFLECRSRVSRSLFRC